MMKKIVSFGISVFFVLGSAMALYAYHFIHSSPGSSQEKVVFNVPQGAFYKTARALEKKGLISNPKYFRWYAKLRGDANKIQIGEYELSKGDSPKKILDKLTSGDTLKYSLTIPEGYNIFEIADLLEAKNLVEEERFLSYVQDPAVAKKYTGLEVRSLEGFLYPNTYAFSKQDSLSTIVKTMYKEFEKAYKRLMKKENKLSMDKLAHITLASIIEKETGLKSERALVSSVFHNRLKKNMRLQTDPTILYGVMVEDGTWIKRIRTVHLRRKTAYNTYRINGLPPGPIANPGIKSMHAALNPAESDYLYFVSRNDGSHVFSKTYKEHNQAVKKYQLNQ